MSVPFETFFVVGVKRQTHPVFRHPRHVEQDLGTLQDAALLAVVALRR
jgi:hypothetical protein